MKIDFKKQYSIKKLLIGSFIGLVLITAFLSPEEKPTPQPSKPKEAVITKGQWKRLYEIHNCDVDWKHATNLSFTEKLERSSRCETIKKNMR